MQKKALVLEMRALQRAQRRRALAAMSRAFVLRAHDIDPIRSGDDPSRLVFIPAAARHRRRSRVLMAANDDDGGGGGGAQKEVSIERLKRAALFERVALRKVGACGPPPSRRRSP